MLTTYSIALFLHVCGAFGLTIGFCASFYSLLALRRAQNIAQARIIGTLMTLLDPLSIVGGLLALFSGLYLTAQAWSFTTGWIDVAIGSYVALAALNGAIVQRQWRAISTLARQTADGPLAREITQRIRHPLLTLGLTMQLSLLVAVVFLMTTKPSLTIALTAVALALVVGGSAGLLWNKSTPTAQQMAIRAE